MEEEKLRKDEDRGNYQNEVRKRNLSKQALLDDCLQAILLEARLSPSNIDTSFSTHKYVYFTT